MALYEKQVQVLRQQRASERVRFFILHGSRRFLGACFAVAPLRRALVLGVPPQNPFRSESFLKTSRNLRTRKIPVFKKNDDEAPFLAEAGKPSLTHGAPPGSKPLGGKLVAGIWI